MKKRIIWGMVFVLSVTSCFLSGCGKKGGTDSAGTKSTLSEEDKDCVYKYSEIDDERLTGVYFDSFAIQGDDLYTSFYGDDGSQAFVRFQNGEGSFSKITLENEDVEYSTNKFDVDEDGNIYAIVEKYEPDGSEAYDGAETEMVIDTEENESEEDEVSEDNETAEEASEGDEATESEEVAEDEETSEEYDDEYLPGDKKIAKFTPDGNCEWMFDVADEDEESYISSVSYVKDSCILCCTEKGISMYSIENGSREEIRSNSGEDDYIDRRIYRIRDGKTYLFEPDSDWKYSFYEFDPKAKKFGEGQPIPDDLYVGSNLYPGKTYDFYYAQGDCIYGLNLADFESKKVCDYTLSDLDLSYTNYVGELTNGDFIIVSDSSNASNILGTLTKVDPSEVVEKETLVIGTIFIDDAVRKAVVKFNQNSDKYRIKIKNYGEQDYDSFEDMTSKMNLDITSGNAPDIVVLDSYIPYESYIAKGVFEPLDSYLENDEELSKTEFLENIMDAGKRNGKQMMIIPSFSIVTAVSSKDMVGDTVVTWDNAEELCKQNNIEDKYMMGMLFKDSTYELYTSIGGSFIDWENGTCSFDSDEFKKFLEFNKKLPERTDDYDYQEEEVMFREKKGLLRVTWISEFTDYQTLEKGYFGTDVNFNGFPTADGTKSYISPNLQLAMSKDCKHKDAAWEFLKIFLQKDYQENLQWAFPVREDSLKALEEKAQEDPYYIDEEGKKQPDNSVWCIGEDIEIEIKAMSPEKTAQLVDFIKSISDTMHYDEKVNEIIQEETGAYFEDQKTVDEVTNIIQSRISLYLSESR